MASENKVCTMCDKLGLKPFTKENVFYYYMPIHGIASYAALSVNIMNPKSFSNIFPKKDITNVLLASSIIGTAFYIYGRPHLKTKSITNGKRGAYAVLGASLFSMGSVLGWAIIKSVLPKNNTFLATIAGLGTGAVIVKISRDYFVDADKTVVGSN